MLFNDINTWFNNNKLNLNFSKTHYLEFRSIKHNKINMQIQHNHNSISNTSETKFLGLIIDDTLLWKQHIDQLIKNMYLFCSHSHYYELRCNLLVQLLLNQKGICISKENHQNHYKY
jgi:hypothetical protein